MTTLLPPITRVGTTLQISNIARRVSGANCYWLGLSDNEGGTPGTFPAQSQITAALSGIKTMGANLVRAHTIGISAGTSMSYLTGYTGTTPNYVELNMAAADWAVYQAGLQGIYLMVPLTDNWNYYHSGLWWFVHQAYLQNSSGITDVNGSIKDDTNNRQFFANTTAGLRIRALYKAYITQWLNHVNPYTGLAYKDDPTLAIIETGNEIYYAAQLGTNEWTQDIASTIKTVAPNKLVADGSAASGQATSTMPGLTAASVDIVGGHYYPQDPGNGWAPTTFAAIGGASSFGGNSALLQLAADVTAALGANRVYINGEYPWTRTDVASWYSALQANAGVSGDFFWSFIGNTTGGVPDTHGGTFGSDDYPVHYPYSGANETTYAPALAAHITAQAAALGPPGIPALTQAAALFISSNPILIAGQEGYEVDTGEVKVGDGFTPWSGLSYRFKLPLQPGPLANRPPPSPANLMDFYIATDKGTIYQSTGSAWIALWGSMPIVSASMPTASRPAPGAAGVGAMLFDTTLNKPVWCTGTSWVDATGAVA